LQQRKTYRKHHAPARLRRTCLRARRLVQRARGITRLPACNSSFRSARKALKLAIRDSKRESYLKLCDELENDPWGRAYKTVVKRVNAGIRSTTDPAVLESIVLVLFPEGRPHCIPRWTRQIGSPICPVKETEILSMARILKNSTVKTLLFLHPGAVASLYNTCLLEATFPDR